MVKYPKIKNLFVTDDKHKYIKEYQIDFFDNVKNIVILEKIDGTNAQIVLNINYETLATGVRFCSRENDIERNDIMFIADTCCKKLKLDKIVEWYYNKHAIDRTLKLKEKAPEVRLFGEVYGDKINSGRKYSKDRNFRLFDVMIGNHFLDMKSVIEIAEEIQMKTVPVIYSGQIGSLLEYEQLKKFLEKFTTRIRDEEGSGGLAEGIVIKAEPLLLNKYGERIICKVKRKEFVYEPVKETIEDINPEDEGREETYRRLLEQ